jgi:fatty-acyl-CoA synthase
LSVRHYDWIAHFGRRTPNKVAVIDLASERQFTYAQFDIRISRLAAHLRDRLGIKRGDRVAVLALNTSDTLEVQFACGRIGAVFLPLNTRLTVPELHYIVGDAAPVLVIHDAELAEVALSVACWGPAAATRRRLRPRRRSKARKSSRSMTSRPSCTPRAPRASRRAPSSPTA